MCDYSLMMIPNRLAIEAEELVAYRFQSGSIGRAFSVALMSRVELVDHLTGTATPTNAPTRYAANLLEVLQLPEQVFKARTTATGVKAIWEAAAGEWLPPFVLQGGEVCSFHPFKTSAGKKATSISIESLQMSEDGERLLVWLLNENLYRHLRNRGLAVDKKRKRAYFPRTESGERPVAYQARLRRATRVVTKPIVSPSSQKVRYWEHKGWFLFSFERFGSTWTLQILPTYIFTKDGKYELLNGERVGSLATKRASRDYNNHVHNALVFWSWVVSGGENEPFCLETVESNRLPSNEKSRGATNKRGMRGKKLPETILPDGDSSPARILIAPNLAGGVSTDQAPEPESLVSVLDGSSEIFPELEDELTLLAEVNETEQGDAA